VAISRPRRLSGIILATVVAGTAAIIGGIPPAQALPVGQLYSKGTGSLYARVDVISLGVIPGEGAKTWSYKVVNPGPTSQRFDVGLDNISAGVTASLSVNGGLVSAPYSTPVLAPGASQVVTLKMRLAAGLPQGTYLARVTLSDPEFGLLHSSWAAADATYQQGNTSHDLLMRTGTQPFVGGSNTQYETASTLRTGTSATFVLRLQNSGPAPARIYAQLFKAGYFCPGKFSVAVRQGLSNVTSAVRDGSYSVLLAPGGRKDLMMTVKLTGAPCADEDFFAVRATGPDGEVEQYAHVIIAR
jgi:hypothetical protein